MLRLGSSIRFLFISSLAAILISFTACSGKKQTESNVKNEICITDSLAKIIRIDTAFVSNVDDEVKLSGEVSFNDNRVVKVFPFSSGKVIDVKVSLGDKVSKGQVLAVIKSADVAGNYSDLSS